MSASARQRSTVCVLGAADIAETVSAAAPGAEVHLAPDWPAEGCAGVHDRELFVVADDAMAEQHLDALTGSVADGRRKLILVFRGTTHFSSLYLRRGFRGLLTLERLGEDIEACLAVLGYNGIFADPSDLRRIFDEYCKHHRINKAVMHEREIAEMLIVGRSIKSISAELSINYRSILVYLNEIKRQQGIYGNKSELVAYFKRMLAE